MKKIFLITNSTLGIPQKLSECESLNLKKISNILDCANIKNDIITYYDFVNNSQEFNMSGCFFFYASSQYQEYKHYIEDIMLDVERRGGNLLPSYDMLRCHENKFYQEIVKKRLSLPSPRSLLIGSLEDNHESCSWLSFPCVAKLPFGFGSSTVGLLSSMSELKLYIKNNLIATVKKRKNIFAVKKKNSIYKGNYPLSTGRIILQEYVSELEYDWKVLVFWDKIFTLKRFVRKNDFRASGSGNFDKYATPSNELLTFCSEIRHRLNTPFVSLDIVEKNNNFFVIEFQCLHFGPYTAMRSEQHYQKTSTGSYTIIKENVDIDDLYGNALVQYINNYKMVNETET